MRLIYKEYYLSLLLVLTVACKKLVQVEPPVTSITGNSVYSDDVTATAVLNGIYGQMSLSPISIPAGLPSISIYAGLSSDELTLYSGITSPMLYYYTNSLSVNTAGFEYWQNVVYPTIYVCNSAIQGLSKSTTLTPAIKRQLLGEAKFMRAFYYFYLINLYGDAPWITGTDFTANALLPRTPKAQVWQQITADLRDAENLLSNSYLDGTLLKATAERVRPTQGAATALLARTFLYTGTYDSAVVKASKVIKNSSLYSLNQLNGVFLSNSTESIWQLQPVQTGWNTQDAQIFIIPASGPGSGWPVYLSPQLLNSFENGDQRRYSWVDSIIIDTTTYYFPYKYKSATLNAPVTEYETVLRLGEQYLIRAEAEARLNNLLDAANDLNTIRNRAGLSPTIAKTQSDMITAIHHERQVELFTEWGHRWLDLKRNATVNAIMSVVTPNKSGAWKSDWQWYPVPSYDLQHDPNLIQNSGY